MSKNKQIKNEAQTHNIKTINFKWKFKLTVEDVRCFSYLWPTLMKKSARCKMSAGGI